MNTHGRRPLSLTLVSAGVDSPSRHPLHMQCRLAAILPLAHRNLPLGQSLDLTWWRGVPPRPCSFTWFQRPRQDGGSSSCALSPTSVIIDAVVDIAAQAVSFRCPDPGSASYCTFRFVDACEIDDSSMGGSVPHGVVDSTLRSRIIGRLSVCRSCR